MNVDNVDTRVIQIKLLDISANFFAGAISESRRARVSTVSTVESEEIEGEFQVTCCWLYRHFDAEGALLYVGITVDMPRRGREHATTSEWFERAARTTFESFLTRGAALEAERTAVIVERPRYNIVYRRQAQLVERKQLKNARVLLKEARVLEREKELEEYLKSITPVGKEGEIIDDDGHLIGYVVSEDFGGWNSFVITGTDTRSLVGTYLTYEAAESSFGYARGRDLVWERRGDLKQLATEMS
jgi:predicted GIY-YIG superfamily endonuclease